MFTIVVVELMLIKCTKREEKNSHAKMAERRASDGHSLIVVHSKTGQVATLVSSMMSRLIQPQKKRERGKKKKKDAGAIQKCRD